MGCDIHMNVEVRRDGRWHYVDPREESQYVPGYFHWWNDRSYITFSVLAGVRADEGDPPPISEPRGYPDDADPITLLDPDRDADGEHLPTSRHQNHGDHSHSWLTLDEIFAYNWGVEYEEAGVVGIREYARCKSQKDTPQTWSSWVGGANTLVMTPAKADKWLKTDEAKLAFLNDMVNGDPDRYIGDFAAGRWVEWKWTVRLDDRCEPFLTWARSLPTLLDAAPEDVRLVFSFDS